MGKLLGILMIVLGVWVGLEVYTEGTHHAFGGRLAFLGDPDDEEREAPVRRVGTSVGRNHAEADARRDRMLGD